MMMEHDGTQLERNWNTNIHKPQTHHHGELIAPARALVQECSNVFNRRPALLGGNWEDIGRQIDADWTWVSDCLIHLHPHKPWDNPRGPKAIK